MSFDIRLIKLLARVRAPIFLLGAMLLASLVVSGFTLQLLSAHRTQLDEAYRASRAQALDLLASRVEHAILASLRPPFQVLGGSVAEADPERLALVGASFREVEQIWLWDGSAHLRAGWSRIESDQRPTDDQWLARRLRSVIAERRPKSPTISTFVENLDNEPALFAVNRMNDQTPGGHWAVIQFDLATLRERSVTPLLTELAAARGGRIELQDPEAEWDDNALHEPLTRALPGWLLSYWPDANEQDAAHGRDQRLLLGVSGGAVLALLLATYAVWRELRRERSLVELRNRFVANVSHELKTPLALIRMYAETLSLGRIQDETRRQRYYETIVRESERLT
jgi:signal transduction histidine kinase